MFSPINPMSPLFGMLPFHRKRERSPSPPESPSSTSNSEDSFVLSSSEDNAGTSTDDAMSPPPSSNTSSNSSSSEDSFVYSSSSPSDQSCYQPASSSVRPKRFRKTLRKMRTGEYQHPLNKWKHELFHAIKRGKAEDVKDWCKIERNRLHQAQPAVDINTPKRGAEAGPTPLIRATLHRNEKTATKLVRTFCRHAENLDICAPYDQPALPTPERTALQTAKFRHGAGSKLYNTLLNALQLDGDIEDEIREAVRRGDIEIIQDLRERHPDFPETNLFLEEAAYSIPQNALIFRAIIRFRSIHTHDIQTLLANPHINPQNQALIRALWEQERQARAEQGFPEPHLE